MADPFEVGENPQQVAARRARAESVVTLVAAIIFLHQAFMADILPTTPKDEFLIENEVVLAESRRISDIAYLVEAIAPDSSQDGGSL